MIKSLQGIVVTQTVKSGLAMYLLVENFSFRKSAKS